MSLFENINKSVVEIKEQIERDEKASDYAGNLVDNLESFYSHSLIPKMRTSDYLKAASGWVYGCVGVIADEVAGIQLKLLKIKGDEISYRVRNKRCIKEKIGYYEKF